MSFLKIGDRAAGAIKSGGTTRRAAKMVVLDLDHPDIEEFINWKVVEEQKVAALVTGSKLLNRHLNAILKACHTWPKPEERFDRASNADLRKAIADAVAALVPANYIERVVQLARQGFTSLQVEEYDTDWNSKAYFTVSGQNSNNSVRIDNAFMEAVEKDGPWHLYWRTEKEKARREKAARRSRARRCRPATCGTRSPTPPGPGRPGRAVRHHHQRVAHLPGRWPDQCVESVHRIHVPRRHGLQPRVAQPARSTTRQTSRFDVDSFRHACRLWTLILEISVYMAQFPSVGGGAEVVRLPHARPGLRQPRLAAHGAGHSLRLAGRPGPVRGPHGLMHAAAYATSAEMRRRSGRSRATRPTARRCCASSATTAGPPTTLAEAEYEGLTHHAGRHRRALLPGLPAPGRRRKNATACWSWARSTASATPRSPCIAPTGTIGLGHGLRHHRRRAGLRPGQVQEARRRRLLQDHQRLDPAGPRTARLHAGADRRHRPLLPRHRHAAGLPAHQPGSLKAKGFTDELSQRIEAQLPAAFELPFVFNRWTLGDDVSAATSSASRRNS